jgi:hypothetical protein
MIGTLRIWMGGCTLAACLALLATGCTKKDTPKTSKPASMQPPPVEMSAAMKPPPYPGRWIREARRKHLRQSCRHLVYKKGCSATRTGRVKIRVTLTADGKVMKVDPVANTVTTDPKLVMKCVLKNVAGWTFRPPKAVLSTFELELIFADKC